MAKKYNVLAGMDALDIVNGAIGEGALVPVGVPADALVKREDGGFTYKKFTLTANGMDIPDGTSGDEWVEVGQVIKSLEDSISWVIGDWAAYANAVWGTSYEDIAAEFDYEVDTLMVYASVCRAVPTLIRNQGAGMSMAHGRVIAKLDPITQSVWAQYWARLRPKVADFKKDVSAAAAEKLVGDELEAALVACVQAGQLLHQRITPSLVDGSTGRPLALPNWSDGRRLEPRSLFVKLENVVDGKLRLPPRELTQTIELMKRWMTAIEQAAKGWQG